MNLRKDHSHAFFYARNIGSDIFDWPNASRSRVRVFAGFVLAGSSFVKARVNPTSALNALFSRLTAKSYLSAFNVSAQESMKSAAKCDSHCELQISVNQ